MVTSPLPEPRMRLKHPHHPLPVPRPGRRLRQMLYLALAATLLSGLGWLLAHYLLPLPEDAARHPLETWSIRSHGLAAMFALAVHGAYWQQHIAHASRQRRHFVSGILLLAAWLLLILSGYGLYYLTDEGLRATTSLAHWSIGLALPVALLAHLRQRWRLRRPST